MTKEHDLGFRDPPDIVSMSCLTYMARVMELRNFIAMFFRLVKSSQVVRQQLKDDDLKAVLAENNALHTYKYEHSTFEQIVGELMLSRSIESFDLYLISILREIFLSRPEMLKSEGKIDVSDVIELKNFEDIVAKVAEKKLHELSYKPLADLQGYIEKTTGINLFANQAIFDTVLVASEVRNLIAHNDCCINDIFRQRVKNARSDYELSERGKVKVSDEWLRRASYTLDAVVFRFDEAVCSKFEITKYNRMTTFFMRP